MFFFLLLISVLLLSSCLALLQVLACFCCCCCCWCCWWWWWWCWCWCWWCCYWCPWSLEIMSCDFLLMSVVFRTNGSLDLESDALATEPPLASPPNVEYRGGRASWCCSLLLSVFCSHLSPSKEPRRKTEGEERERERKQKPTPTMQKTSRIITLRERNPRNNGRQSHVPYNIVPRLMRTIRVFPALPKFTGTQTTSSRREAPRRNLCIYVNGWADKDSFFTGLLQRSALETNPQDSATFAGCVLIRRMAVNKTNWFSQSWRKQWTRFGGQETFLWGLKRKGGREGGGGWGGGRRTKKTKHKAAEKEHKGLVSCWIERPHGLGTAMTEDSRKRVYCR